MPLTANAQGAIAVLAFEPLWTGVDPAAFRVAVDAAVARHFRGGGRTDAAVRHGVWVDADGQPIDEVLAVRWSGGAVEVHAHGNPALVAAIETSIATRVDDTIVGSRPSLDRLADDTPAVRAALESLLIHAATPLVAKVALAQPDLWATEFNALAALLENGDHAAASVRCEQLLTEGAAWARALESPPRVAIAGPPNAGKSTLINALVGAERCLATAIAGTTRDLVVVPASLNGLPVALIDTAGLPAPTADGDAIAREAEARARRAWAESEIGVIAIPADAPGDIGALGALQASRAGPVIVAVSKTDLLDDTDTAIATIRERFATVNVLGLCAPRSEGLGDLATAIWAACRLGDIDPVTTPIPLDPIDTLLTRPDATHYRATAAALRRF